MIVYNIIYNISFSGIQIELVKELEYHLYFENDNNVFNIQNFKFAVANNNNIFICYYMNEKGYYYIYINENNIKTYNNYYYTICDLYYNFINYTEIPCIYVERCSNYKTFYFQEKDEFVLLCKLYNKFILSIIKNKDYPEIENNKCIIKTISINCKYYNNDYSYDGEYSLIYDNTLNDYILIIDDNFTKSKECILNNENTIEYQFKDNITFNKTKYDFQDENVSNSIYNYFKLYN